MAMPPGFLGPAASAVDASSLWHGSDEAHSAAAIASQCVSCKRQTRPCSRCRTSTALLLAACCVLWSRSQRRFQHVTSAASSRSRNQRARNSSAVMSPKTSSHEAAAGAARPWTAR
eukprot:13965829-Alexandrium_andersonii.AAC.1